MRASKIFKNPAILIATAAVIILSVFTAGVLRACTGKTASSSTATIAFYGLDQNLENMLTVHFQKLCEQTGRNFKFQHIDDTANISVWQLKNYELVIMKNGKSAELLSEHALELPENLFAAVPNSLSADRTRLPFLLDHYETSFYKTVQNSLNLQLPENYAQLKDYLKAERSSSLVENPLICAGRDDDELLGFISNTALTLSGSDSYLKIAEDLSETDGKQIPDSLKTVLDEIKNMQNEGLIMKNWYDVTIKDILEYYFKERKTGIYHMSLSLHRKVEHLYIKYYKTTDFPAQKGTAKKAITGSQICAFAMNDRFGGIELLSALISSASQEELSDRTHLAPVNKKCGAFDAEADDVRYWAASSDKGVLPHLGYAAFDSAKKRSLLAKTIRFYLSSK